MLEFRQARVLADRGQRPGQLGDDRLEKLGLKDARGLREAAQREAFDAAEGLGHRAQFRRRLQLAQGVDQGVPDVQEHELAVIAEEQRAVAGRVALAADVVESVQEGKDAAEVPEADDVLVLERGL